MRNRTSKNISDSSLNLYIHPPPGISEEKWHELVEIQERDTIVLEMREEIISKVLDKCQEIYLKKKSVEFLVDCAHEAWKQIIYLSFFNHDPGSDGYQHNICWSPDTEPDTCEADTLASKNVATERDKSEEKEVIVEQRKELIEEKVQDNVLFKEVSVDAISEEDSSIKSLESNLDYPEFQDKADETPPLCEVSSPRSSAEETTISSFTTLKTLKKTLLPLIQGRSPIKPSKQHSHKLNQPSNLKIGEDEGNAPHRYNSFGKFRLDVKAVRESSQHAFNISLPPIASRMIIFGGKERKNRESIGITFEHDLKKEETDCDRNLSKTSHLQN